MRFSSKLFYCVTFVMALLFAAVGVVAQPATNANQKPAPASFAGNYEGTVKTDTGEQKLSLNVVDDAGKFSGSLTTARGSFKIIKGAVADGALTLDIERPGGGSGPMTLRQNGGNLTATFSEAGKNVTVEFRRIVADEISGEWDAAADAQGQPFPFTLVLKLDGEKVTGSSSSQLGDSQISQGTWKDGKLTLLINGQSGAIGLIATLDGSKLVGDYDFAGQLQGKWVAIRKK
ncbi:MAG TPA: hypothetical protein VJT71_05265 [Pyrinomonadaceae bacterium]|nr:hypothetical protein [Pyrinomonadaceae bacterium]